jgi:hypothetical protein
MKGCGCKQVWEAALPAIAVCAGQATASAPALCRPLLPSWPSQYKWQKDLLCIIVHLSFFIAQNTHAEVLQMTNEK